MRIHRIHSSEPLAPERECTLQGQAAHYLSRVLRVAAGQTVVLFNGDGHDYVCEVMECHKNGVRLRVDTRVPARGESWLRVTVVQAVSRGERFDASLQKCTELGAAAFQPLLTERTEVRIRPEKLERRMAHWRSVVVSACEQSGRALIPEIAPPATLEQWLPVAAGGLRIALDPGAEESLAGVEPGNRVELLIGPEGGFSDPELQRMKAAGVRCVRLGPRILRTETAGPAALAVLQATSGDLS